MHFLGIFVLLKEENSVLWIKSGITAYFINKYNVFYYAISFFLCLCMNELWGLIMCGCLHIVSMNFQFCCFFFSCHTACSCSCVYSLLPVLLRCCILPHDKVYWSQVCHVPFSFTTACLPSISTWCLRSGKAVCCVPRESHLAVTIWDIGCRVSTNPA